MFLADPEINMEYDKKHESGIEPLPGNQNGTKQYSQLPKEATTPINDKKHQLKQQESVDKVTSNTEPSNTESGLGGPPKLKLEQKVNNKIELQNNPDKKIIHKSPSTSQEDVSIMCMEFLQFELQASISI